MTQNLWHYLNTFNPSYQEDLRVGLIKKRDSWGSDDEESRSFVDDYSTVKMVRRLNQLNAELFEQIGLYYFLCSINKTNLIDHSTTSEMKRFSFEGDLILSMFDVYFNSNYDTMYKKFSANSSDDIELVKTLYNKVKDRFYSINLKYEQLMKRTGTKARFGDTLMIFIVISLLALSGVGQVNADVCCSFAPNHCPFATNPFSYQIMSYNGEPCNNYISRYVEDNNSTIHVTECQSSMIDPSSCINSCEVGCNGNEAFCDNRTCGGNKCNCDTFPIKYVYNCLNEEGEEIGESNFDTYTCYTSAISDFKKRVLFSCPQIDVLSDKDYFYTTINTDYAGCVLYVNKDVWSFQNSYMDSNLVVKIDETAKARSGKFEVRINCNSNPCHHSSVYANYDVQCVVIDCIFCWEVFSSMNCLPFSYKVFAFFVILFTIAMILAALPCFWIPIYTTWKCLMFPKAMCWPMLKKRYDEMHKKLAKKTKDLKKKNQAKSAKMSLEEQRGYEDPDYPSEIVSDVGVIIEDELAIMIKEREIKDKERLLKLKKENEKFSSRNSRNDSRKSDSEKNRTNYGRQGNINNGTNNMLVAVLIIGIVFNSFEMASAITCTNNPPISVSAPSCVGTSASSESCTFTFSTTISIPYPGASACLIFNDQNNKLLGSLNVTYVNRTDIATLTTSYYTGRWKPLSNSFHGCYLNGWCDNNCASATARNMYSFPPLIATYPGFTYCRRSCGCAGCGCGFCDAGCVVSGYALQFQDSAMAVAEVNRLNYIYYLQYSYANTITTWSQSSASNTIGPFKIDYVGSFSGDNNIVFGTKNVIFNNSVSYWGEASPLNSPSQQNIGDIQSSSQNLMQAPDVSAFIYDPNIVSSIDQDKSTTFYFTNPGMNNINQYPKFPTMIGGQVWSYTSGQMKSVASSPGAVVLTITTTSPITLTRIKTTVCPTGSFLSGSGCYNCDIGSSIIVTLKSTCSAGLVRLSTDSTDVQLNTQSLNIGTAFSNYEIDLYTSKQVNNFLLIVSSDGNIEHITISFAAVENVTVRTDNQTSQNNVSGGPSSGWSFSFPNWDSFINSLSDLSSPFHYASILITIIAVVVMFFMTIFIGKWILSSCSLPKRV